MAIDSGDPDAQLPSYGPIANDLSADRLSQFPPVLSPTGEISKNQLGWRMAVLPFRATGSADGHAIAFGMAEELSAAISRFRSPQMIAPVTFWDGIGPAEDALARSRLYQLDYIMDGTITCEGDAVTINVVLIDVVLDCEVIWTRSFDGSIQQLHELQARICGQTVLQLDPELFRRGPAFDLPVQTTIPAAHHAVLTAIGSIYSLDKPRFMRARALLEQAIQLDPNYAAAHSWLAYWSIMAVGLGRVSNPGEVTGLAATSATRALELLPTDARAVAVAGHVKAYLLHDVPSALELHKSAISLNPNLPIAWTMSSWSQMYNGDHVTAANHAKISIALSPRDPHIFLAEHALMDTYLFRRKFEQAEVLSNVILSRDPIHVSAMNIRLAILGHVGRLADCSELLSQLREIQPDVSVTKIADRAPLRPRDRALYIEGLRLAGVPE